MVALLHEQQIFGWDGNVNNAHLVQASAQDQVVGVGGDDAVAGLVEGLAALLQRMCNKGCLC